MRDTVYLYIPQMLTAIILRQIIFAIRSFFAIISIEATATKERNEKVVNT